ncbi:hypothetical protein [Frankia sp. AgW1.1]|uniref:hypothetical protein n=1 Tax=Frankia sp. AgW1.1 TaxID=1836971 RepID=UPI001931DBB6|nr:hypothetical protein [Frankia sp. AgW1.1]MBL7492518.1 hypothetical protein [Frankia sp. AgW1.1]
MKLEAVEVVGHQAVVRQPAQQRHMLITGRDRPVEVAVVGVEDLDHAAHDAREVACRGHHSDPDGDRERGRGCPSCRPAR